MSLPDTPAPLIASGQAGETWRGRRPSYPFPPNGWPPPFLFPRRVYRAGMDERTAEILALNAGLQKAWANHRADVLNALASLAAHQANLPRARDPSVEPVPAYGLRHLPG